MNADHPASSQNSGQVGPDDSALSPRGSSNGRQRLLGAILIGLLLLTAGGIYWWKSDPPAVPPMPANITEAEVRAVIEKSRDKVIAEPRSGEAWGEYGTILLAHLFDQEAKTCFEQATQLDPNDPRWPYARAQIAMKREPEKTVELLEMAVKASTYNARYRQAVNLTLAETLLERGEFERAKRIFEDENASDPRSKRAIFGLGLIALASNDDEQATRYFRQAQSDPSCRKQATAKLAQLAFAQGDTAKARQLESEASAMEADPPWPDPYLDHVVTLQVGRRGDLRRIALLERDGRFDDALKAFEAQLREDRTSHALTGAAVNLARLQQFDRAIDYLREAVRVDEKDSNAHYTLALVLFNKAERKWVEDPSSAEAMKWFSEVVQEAQKTAELKPDHTNAYLFWGLSLLHLGEAKAALEPLRKGLVIRPEEFELHLGLGQSLAATGNKKGAEASFTTAQQLRPEDPRPAMELEKLKRIK